MMKIDNTRYAMFWKNPERYRLREIWKVAPKQPTAGTFAHLLSYGRRRGTCTHAFLDAAYLDSEISLQSRLDLALPDLRDGGFEDKEIAAGRRLATALYTRYAPGELLLGHERLFDTGIPNSDHSITGRIDHLVERDGEVLIVDTKTSKMRTKGDMAKLLDHYRYSSQPWFYFAGARSVGFDPRAFVFRVVEDRHDKNKKYEPAFHEVRVELDEKYLRNFIDGVKTTCNIIEGLKAREGTQRPWPLLAEATPSGCIFQSPYAQIFNYYMVPGFIPENFETATEHLSTMETEPSEADIE